MGHPASFRHPGKLFVAQYGAATEGSDVIKYASFLRQQSGLSDEPPVGLVRIFDHFGIIPKRVSLPGQAGLLLNPDNGLIFINEDDPGTRQRFSEAHELMEYLFAAQSRPTGWSARGLFSQSVKEKLCEEGAADLLMPLSTFRPYVNKWGVSLETGKRLAAMYNVSLTAALLRTVRFGPGRHAFVLWGLALKPIEERTLPSDCQLALFDEYPAQPPPEKLRVCWGCSTRDELFIPKHKSVEFDTTIYRCYELGMATEGTDWIDLKSVYGQCSCESMPVTLGEERCVLSVIHLPGDEHSIASSLPQDQ